MLELSTNGALPLYRNGLEWAKRASERSKLQRDHGLRKGRIRRVGYLNGEGDANIERRTFGAFKYGTGGTRGA